MIPRSLESELHFDPLRGGWWFLQQQLGNGPNGYPTGLGTSLSPVLPLPPLPVPSQPSAIPTPEPVGQQSPHWPTPQVYVLKRPHVDEFLQRMGELFECVLFTASLAKVSPPSSEGFLGQPCPALPSASSIASGQ